MGWQLLATIQTTSSWLLTPVTGGQLFRIRSTSNSSSPSLLKAVIAQVVGESDFTVFDSRRISYKSETEAFLFVLPESLSLRKLAIKRLDDSSEPWTLEIEELDIGGINLPIYPSDITGLSETLASKADSSHSHTTVQISGLTEALIDKAPTNHNHAIANVTGLSEALINKADSNHNHATVQISGLTEALDNKADLNHNHAIANVTGLSDALAAKADSNHNHTIASISDFPVIPTLWYPESFTHWHQDSTVVVGGALSSTNSGNQRFYTYAAQGVGAINDAFKFRAFLAGGNYELKFLGTTQPAHGILSLSINGTPAFDNLDWYSPPTVWNVIKTVTISIPASGINEFMFSVKSKNSSSTGYGIKLTQIRMQKQ